MSAPPDARTARTLRRLLPPGPDVSIAEVVGALDLGRSPGTSPPDRPYVALNMIATVDGRATLQGRTASLGNWADRELFHGLRSVVDAVMVGAGTVRDERYGRIVPDPRTRERRRAAGLSDEPLAVVVSESLNLPPDLPLLGEPEARVVIITGSSGQISPCPAQVSYVRAPDDGEADLPRALRELRDRFAVASLLTEGGPRLNATLLQAAMLDELFLSVSPGIAGGADALRIVHGPELTPPAELELISALESQSHLFLRYGVATR